VTAQMPRHIVVRADAPIAFAVMQACLMLSLTSACGSARRSGCAGAAETLAPPAGRRSLRTAALAHHRPAPPRKGADDSVSESDIALCSTGQATWDLAGCWCGTPRLRLRDAAVDSASLG
jgi:hypothetical protein